MADAKLFSSFEIQGVRFANRIWVSPMAQFQARYRESFPTDAHLVQYGSFAQGGFALTLTEATAVSPTGLMTPYDVGLWAESQAEQWRRVTDFIHSQKFPVPEGGVTNAKIGVQLSHAGRRASSRRSFPGEPGGPLEAADGGWQTVGPSSIPYPGYPVPHEMSSADIGQVVRDFTTAARRAVRAGFDVVEINAADGNLLHQFYSPLSNNRIDSYGGSYSNRVRLLREVTSSVRAVWQGPLIVRVAATDWSPDGWDGNDSVALSVLLRTDGVDIIDVSTGGNAMTQIPVQPGYQVPFAQRIRHFAGIRTIVGGMITDPRQADDIVSDDQADAVLLGRAALREPHWPQRAAAELGMATELAPYPPQLLPGAWPTGGRPIARPT